MKISIIGKGFVGSAIYKSFSNKGIVVKGYDKYKESDSFLSCLESNILFLCLPTEYSYSLKQYDKSALYEICEKLETEKYLGTVIIKSTVEPNTTTNLSKKYKSLHFIHNPEFLTAKTAFEDFDNQTHIVLGNCNLDLTKLEELKRFYLDYYPNASISVCSSTESESMKIFCNSFYAVKIQFFNELYDLCIKTGQNFDTIKNLMLKNDWINPMHTDIPGTDGKLSYGGYCFPKDTMALLNHMEKNESDRMILSSCVAERDLKRNDTINCKNK